MPFFFDLRQQACLLVGGGEIALRKARLLTQAAAVIDVVAPDCEPELAALVKQNGGQWLEAGYHPDLLDSRYVLVIAATDSDVLNAAISADAKARRLPVNVVDSPELCSIITPAIVDRDPLTIAISSGGDTPVLARKIRSQLEASIPGRYGDLAKLAARYRDKAKQRFGDIDSRRRFWEAAMDGPIAERALAGDMQTAETLLESALSETEMASTGEVYLVGAGPGDPDLLTFKALRLMQRAEVVLYDRLVSEPILAMARKDAEYIYVGKQRSEHAVPQNAINELLLEHAQRGRRVLRLKGGDPFIFGRGAEEIELLAEHGIPFQVVPGITAASGCASYAGIPLTHRDHSQSVRFITGHVKDGVIDFRWKEFVEDSQTLVFYMGLVGLPQICAKLIEHGKSPDTPAALIERGTLPEQSVHLGTLANLNRIVDENNVKAPTLLIIGGVVALHDRLNWYKG